MKGFDVRMWFKREDGNRSIRVIVITEEGLHVRLNLSYTMPMTEMSQEEMKSMVSNIIPDSNSISFQTSPLFHQVTRLETMRQTILFYFKKLDNKINPMDAVEVMEPFFLFSHPQSTPNGSGSSLPAKKIVLIVILVSLVLLALILMIGLIAVTIRHRRSLKLVQGTF